MIGMLRGSGTANVDRGIAEMVVPVIVTAGMSTDASIGNLPTLKLPSMTEAGISTGMRDRNRLTQRNRHPGGWLDLRHTDPATNDWLKMIQSERPVIGPQERAGLS